MAKAKNEDQIKRATIADMKKLNIYKPQYNRVIEIYAGLVFQYEEALAEFELGGRVYESGTGAGGTKKSAIVATMENLRKDILAYSDRLCLNPKALESVAPPDKGKKTSKLAEALRELG